MARFLSLTLLLISVADSQSMDDPSSGDTETERAEEVETATPETELDKLEALLNQVKEKEQDETQQVLDTGQIILGEDPVADENASGGAPEDDQIPEDEEALLEPEHSTSTEGLIDIEDIED